MQFQWRCIYAKQQLLFQQIILMNIILTGVTGDTRRFSGFQETDKTAPVTNLQSSQNGENSRGAVQNFNSVLAQTDPKVTTTLAQVSRKLPDNPVLKRTVSKQEKREVTRTKQPQKNMTNRCQVSGMKYIRWYDDNDRLFDYPGSEMFVDCEFSCCYIHQQSVTKNSESADALIFTANTQRQIPPARRPDQSWIWFSMHPMKTAETSTWNDRFNWTMTYRLDSDLVMPHLTSETHATQFSKNYHKILALKDKKVIWVSHACDTGAKQNEFVKILRKYINVDIFAYDGNCHAPGMMGVNKYYPDMFARYKFAIAFENYLCRDYVTKMFCRILQNNIVPIVSGYANYSLYAPENSYINTQDYATIEELGKHIQYLDSNDSAYVHYLRAKEGYKFNCFSMKTRKSSYCELCRKLHHLSVYAKNIINLNTWMSTCSDANDLNDHSL